VCFRPTRETIHDERLAEVFTDVTDSDRFLWVYERRRELLLEHRPHDISAAARYGSYEKGAS
jgi:hypothetical protein